MNASQWKEKGSYVSINGHFVFVVDTDPGGESGKPVLAILHGYPTSSHDYHLVLEGLAEHFRVVVHDHLGFGLSAKPTGYSYALYEQADVALSLWQELGLPSVHVFAHDYGTSIATEILARRERGLLGQSISSMTLCNGSVHIELAKLRFIQKLLRNHITGPVVAQTTSKRVFMRNMRKLWADPGLLPSSDLDVMWELLIRDGGRDVLPRISQYLRDRVLYWHRWVGALQSTTLLLAFVWGAEDPIVGGNVARGHHEEAAGSTLRLLEGVGHYPMIEAPDQWLEAVVNSIPSE